MTPFTLHLQMNPGTPPQTKGHNLLFMCITENLLYLYYHGHSTKKNVKVIFMLTLSSVGLPVPMQLGDSEKPPF